MVLLTRSTLLFIVICQIISRTYSSNAPLPPPNPGDLGVNQGMKINDPFTFNQPPPPTTNAASPNQLAPSSFGSPPSGIMNFPAASNQLGLASFGASPPLSANSGIMNIPAVDLQAASLTSAARSEIRYCYANGPLLPSSLLSKAKVETHVDAGIVTCEEIVGYLLGLNRWYDRKCANMGPECPQKFRYAIGWFHSAVNQIKGKCNLTL